MTAFAVSLGAGRLVPELSTGAKWPFEVIGVAFALVGVGFITHAYIRHKQVDEALARGAYAPLHGGTTLLFATLGGLLGIATIVLVLVRPA